MSKALKVIITLLALKSGIALAAEGDSMSYSTKATGSVGDTTATATTAASGDSSVSTSSVYKETSSTAYAPSVQVGGQDMCRSGVGAGGQGTAFGISLGGSVIDENCERLKLAREIAVTLGDRETAKALLCQDVRVAQAYATAGKPCNDLVVAKAIYLAPIIVTSTNPMGVR